MALPKLLILLVDDHFVQFVFLSCQLKRQVAYHQCEENDSEGKDIGFICLVRFIFILVTVVYFRGHISLSSTLILQKSKPLTFQQKLTGKAKIANFHTNLSVSFYLFLFRENQHILQLQISMRDTVAVKVINSIDDISKDNFFLVDREVPMFLDVVEEWAMLSVFQHNDVLRVELFILCITQRHPLLIPKRPHDVLVLHLAKKTELVSKVRLLATVRRRHRLQHHARGTGSVCEQRRPAPARDQCQLVFRDAHRRG